MIKSGQTWAGTFNTLDSTGALAAATGTPTGTLYVDGTSNGATVTITGSNPYKWSVTLPSLTAGQRADMYITATISTIATAGIVASEQADTALVSEVKAETASILADTGTDGVVLKAAGLAEDAVNEIVDQVWNEAIADHTTATTFGGKNQKVVPSETINDYKADVSALTNVTLAATQTGVTIPTVTAVTNGVTLADDAITSAKFDESTAYPVKKADALTTELARKDSASSYMADVSGLATPTNITAGTITTVTNLTNAPTNGDFTATMKSSITTAASSATPALSATGIDAILDEVVVGTYTMRQILKLMAAKMHGKATGGGTTSIKYTGLDNVADVIIETVDTNGNRSAVSLTV